VSGFGSVAALAAIALFGLSRAGVVGQDAAAVVVLLLALLVIPPCLAWWSAGPPKLLQSRLLVLAPVFLMAGPAFASLLVLGATVGGASIVFGAAVLAGLLFGFKFGSHGGS
jgi:hypothetical protein